MKPKYFKYDDDSTERIIPKGKQIISMKKLVDVKVSIYNVLGIDLTFLGYLASDVYYDYLTEIPIANSAMVVEEVEVESKEDIPTCKQFNNIHYGEELINAYWKAKNKVSFDNCYVNTYNVKGMWRLNERD